MGACMHGQMSLRYKEQTDLKYKQLEKVDRDRMDFASHRWIGALISHDKNGSCAYGTAVLISSDLILTVAHNIYNSDSKSQYLNFRFYLAPCGAVKEGIQIKKGSWRFPQGFKTSRSDVRYYYDYAIMKLSQPVQLLKEPLALHVMCRQHRDEFKKAELSIYGYPKHSSNYEVREGSEEMELIQYGQTRKDLFHNITEDYRCIEYYISTLPGHSGSPLINSGNIIGLHFGGGIDDSQSYNKGMLITSEVMEQLIIWETELEGSPFIVENERMCPHIPEKIRENAQQRALNRKVQINSAGLRHIDMECYNHFRQINLQTNLLVNIDLSKNKVLSKLYLGQNQLTEIDLRENKMLTHLRLSKNQLRTIDLGTNQELTYVDLSSNQLQEVSLINNRKIKRLWLSENRLRWVNFWWSGILEIHLENQESALCNVDILHRSDDKQGCLRMVQIQETRYNNPSNERTANRHCCAYLFNPVKQV